MLKIKLDKIRNKLNKSILGLLFLLLYFTDCLSKIGDFYTLKISNSSYLIKLLLHFLLLYIIIKKQNPVGLKIIKLIAILGFIFIIGHVFLLPSSNLLYRIINNIKIFDWFILIFIFYSSLISFLENNKQKQEELINLFKAFELVFYLNVLFVVIGLLFKIEIFNAYYNTARFGINGLFRNATHASYIYILYIIYFYDLISKSPTLKNKISFILSITVAIILCTKAIILFLSLLLIYWLLVSKRYLYIFMFLLFNLIALYNLDKLMNLYVKKYSFVIYDVYTNEGMLTMLFSFRNKSITEFFLPYIVEKWSILNYIFGGAEFNLSRTEFEFIDIFWFFGIAGFFLYIYMFLKFLIPLKLLKEHILLIILFIVVFLAGSFFSSAPVMAFLLVLIMYFKKLN